MTSRERVIRAIEQRGPDRIPVHHYLFPGVFRRYGRAVEELLERYPDDFGNRDADASRKAAAADPGDPGRIVEYRDPWGSLWRRMDAYTAGEVVVPALPTWDNWGSYRFPPLPDDGQVAEFRRTVESLHPRHYVLGFGGQLFQQFQFMRGSADALMDVADDRPEMHELLDRLVGYHTDCIRMYAAQGADGIIFGDDWGTQTALFIAPAAFRRIFKPRYRRLFDVVKDAGCHVFLHTDGWTLDILPDFAEIGVDVINPQHHIMGNAAVAARIGTMCIHADLDRQRIIPRGTPEEIAAHVQETVEAFGRRNGGLILHGEIGPEVPLANIEALYRACAT